MQSGTHFADILAEKVGRPKFGTRQTTASRPAFPHVQAPVLLFFQATPAATVTADHRAARAYGIPLKPRPEPSPIQAVPNVRPAQARRSVAQAEPKATPAPAPKPRILTERQMTALTFLVSLGAHLDANFTGRQLKTAFKILARLYHPDRHPGCSEFEKARFARQFAAVHDAYRQLLTALPLPPAA
jgi:hypothetical protein